MEHKFDVVIIGTGTAAATVAGRCSEAGKNVAVIDELPFGGTCALRGCDPKKMLRRGPEIIDAARRMDGNGIASNSLLLDWPALVAFKRSFTDPIPHKRQKSFEGRGIATFHGTARFTGERTLAVGENLLQGDKIVIAAGSEPRRLAIAGEELVTTSTEFMELENLPRRILFIGGGYRRVTDQPSRTAFGSSCLSGGRAESRAPRRTILKNAPRVRRENALPLLLPDLPGNSAGSGFINHLEQLFLCVDAREENGNARPCYQPERDGSRPFRPGRRGFP